MKRVLFASTGIVIGLLAYSAITSNSAQAETAATDVDLSGITGVSSSAGLNVEYEVSDVYTIDIEVTRGDIDDVRVERKGNTLEVGRTRRNGWGWGDRLDATVTVLGPNIERADASSGSDLIVRGVSADVFRAESSSGADLEIEGTCETLRADASSGSDIEANDLRCVNGDLEASSGADIEAYLTGTVNIDVSSGADVTVEGGARIGSAEKSSGADYDVKPGPL